MFCSLTWYLINKVKLENECSHEATRIDMKYISFEILVIFFLFKIYYRFHIIWVKKWGNLLAILSISHCNHTFESNSIYIILPNSRIFFWTIIDILRGYFLKQKLSLIGIAVKHCRYFPFVDIYILRRLKK